jgi:hypothetical protein
MSLDVVGVDESLAAPRCRQGPVAEESSRVQKCVRLPTSLIGKVAGARHFNPGTPDLLFALLVVLFRVGRLLVPASLPRDQKHPFQAQLRHVVTPVVPEQAGGLVVLAAHCANVCGKTLLYVLAVLLRRRQVLLHVPNQHRGRVQEISLPPARRIGGMVKVEVAE